VNERPTRVREIMSREAIMGFLMATSPPSPPLAGWRVLITRPLDQAPALVAALTEHGAEAVLYPTIALGPPPSWRAFDAAAAALSSYDWVIFTSPSAVRFAVARRPGLAGELARPGAPRVAAVGSETARALQASAIPVALVPDDQRQEGLVARFAALGVGTGARVLFPQAVGGRELLSQVLAARGVAVDVVPISRTWALPLDAPPSPFYVATFASPSALRAFVAACGASALEGKIVAVIGPTTETAAHAAGIAVDVIPGTPSVSALVAELVRYRQRP
jgi:uroporphyrinogen III methyltransferase/synthase